MPQNYNPPGHPPKSGKNVFRQYLDDIELRTLSIPLIIRFIRFKVLSTAIDIFCKAFNGFTALKIPVLGSKRGSIMLFWVYLPQNAPKIERKAIFCYILYNFA